MLSFEIFACSYCLMFFYSYFLVDSDGTVQLQQDGAFRSNCMDCLDRTNVIQSLLARRSLQSQLEVRWWWDLLSLLGSSSGQNTCTCRAGPHFESGPGYDSLDSFKQLIHSETWISHWIIDSLDSFKQLIHSERSFQSLIHVIRSNRWFIPKWAHIRYLVHL